MAQVTQQGLKIPPAPSVYGKWLCAAAEGKQGNLQQIGQQLLRLQVERSGTPDSHIYIYIYVCSKYLSVANYIYIYTHYIILYIDIFI